MRLRLVCFVTTAVAATGCAESPGSLPDVPELPSQRAVAGAQPPPPGAEHAGNGPGAVFALHKVFVGETDRDGAADSKNGWKQFGFNIDGFDTQCSGNDCRFLAPHCHPNAGATAEAVFPDGDDGIDNSFGLNILPIFEGIRMDTSRGVDQQIARGELTLLMAIDDLGPDANYNPLAARMYQGARLGKRPKFDGTDVWPVARDWVVDANDIKSAKFQFPGSWVTNDTWVSGRGDLSFYVTFFGAHLTLNLHHAVVAMDLSASREEASGGVISGILDPEDFADQFKIIAGSFDQSLCSGNTIDSIVNQLRQAADIMIDGRIGEDSETCNGISVGFGFEAVKVELGPVVDDPAPPDACGK